MVAPTILITGASSGIGKATAIHFAKRGFQVFASGRSQAELGVLHQHGIITYPMDVTVPNDVIRVRNEIDRWTHGHGLDVLVNCAGYAVGGAVEQVNDADLRMQFEVNALGLMSVTRAFLPAMRRRGNGRIINIGSLAGRFGFPLTGTYSATKHAVRALTDALRIEVGVFGIGVTLVEPGPVRTPFVERTLREARKYESADSPYRAVQAKSEEIRAMTMRRATEPETIVKLIDRAVHSRRAPAYVAGPIWAVWLVRLLSILPTRFSDWILRRAYGLDALVPKSPRGVLEHSHG